MQCNAPHTHSESCTKVPKAALVVAEVRLEADPLR